ncbi:MAG: class I SAM-dependent methyltransferase [Nitrospirota bacterium]|nr:class I SAM-dependent methyltransferase [Nitrospirota bacterium]
MAPERGSLGRRVALAALEGIASLIPSKLARIRTNQKTNRALVRQFGDLRSGEEWKSASVSGLANESTQVSGIVVRTIRAIGQPLESMLLAGEAASAKSVYGSIAGMAPEQIITAGLHRDADHQWNFEHAPPEMGRFQCVVSYAILEHLIDPYRHVRDLANLLESGGHLVIFTVSPGFPYHRHPIDCLRFYPDWFETVADRSGLKIADRFYGSERVVYRFCKP